MFRYEITEPLLSQSERGQLFFDGELDTMLKEFLTFIDGQLTPEERAVILYEKRIESKPFWQ